MVAYLSIFVKLTGVQVGAGGAWLPLVGGCRRGQAKLLFAEGQAGARLLLAEGARFDISLVVCDNRGVERRNNAN